MVSVVSSSLSMLPKSDVVNMLHSDIRTLCKLFVMLTEGEQNTQRGVECGRSKKLNIHYAEKRGQHRFHSSKNSKTRKCRPCCGVKSVCCVVCMHT